MAVDLDNGGLISNSGTITGVGQGINLLAGGTVTNAAGGVIQTSGSVSSNGILVNGSAGTIANSGVMSGGATGDGAVKLQAGGSVANASTGLLTGTVFAVYGSGGATRVTNAGTITATGGPGVLFTDTAGTFSNTLTNSGAISGTGTAVRFGAGNDLLQIAGGATFAGSVDGGAGTNTLEILSGSNILPVLTNFGIVVVDSGAALNLAGARSFATLTNAGTLSNSGALTATGVFTNSGTLINSGSITGSATLTGAGAVQNQAGGVISLAPGIALSGVDLSVVNAGTITSSLASGVVLHSAGTVSNVGSASRIMGRRSGVVLDVPGAVFNAGTLSGNYSYGLSLGAGGRVDNTGMIYGKMAGIQSANGPVAITNQGTIRSAAWIGVNVLSGAATVTNSGTIAAGLLRGPGQGVVLLGGGTVLNTTPTASIISSNTVVNIANASGTVVNAGTISTWIVGIGGIGISLGQGGSVTNTNTGTISATTGILLRRSSVGQDTVDNSGIISGFTSVLSDSNTLILNRNSGRMDGTVQSDTGTVINEGSINGFTYGILFKGAGTVSNTGTISGSNMGVGSRGGIISLSNSGRITSRTVASDGVYLFSGGTVTNSASGVISGYENGIWSHGRASISNAGTITGIHTAGISGDRNAAGLTIVNSGTVSGPTGIAFTDDPSLASAPSNTVINSGTIIGTRGTAVQFASGNDLLQISQGATFAGLVDGGAGANTVEILSGSNTLPALTRFAIAVVDSGATLNLTGIRSFSLTNAGTLSNSGTLTAFGVFTNSGTLINSGSITGSAPLTGSGAVQNQAGGVISLALGIALSGVDLSVVNAGIITSSLASGVVLHSAGTVSNVGSASRIMGRQSGVVLDVPGAVFNAGTLSGNYAYGLSLGAGGRVDNTGMIYGKTAGMRSANGPVAITNQGIIRSGSWIGVNILSGAATVTNSGTITGGYVSIGNIGQGVVLLGGGTVLNTTATARIVGSSNAVNIANATGTVVNAGTISTWVLGIGGTGISLGQGGSVTNANTGTISGTTGIALRGVSVGQNIVDNAGVISGLTSILSVSKALILNRSSGRLSGSVQFSDSGTVINEGSIGGGTYGIRFGGAGTVSNTGTISGSNMGVGSRNGILSLSNSGKITGQSGVSQGVYLFSGGTVTNTASGVISGYENGVWSHGGASISNAGTITGNERAGISGDRNAAGLTIVNSGIVSGPTGIAFTDDPSLASAPANTVINSGTIIGTRGTAVQFASGNDLLQISQGASFVGRVDGGAGSNTVEFVSGTMTNSNIVNFTIAIVDNPATWNTAGSNIFSTVTNAGRISGGLTLSAAGVIDNRAGATISATTGQAVSGSATRITNAGTIVATVGSAITSNSLLAILTNGDPAALIRGAQSGVQLNGAGTVTNAGTLAGGTVVGLSLGLGGSISNTGLIAGGTAAVLLTGGVTTLVNRGIIRGTGIGVNFTGSAQGTIDNFGTISGGGGTAVRFAGGTNMLILESGSQLDGIADGTLGVNTLVVAGSAQLDTVRAYGFQYVGFLNATQAVDANSTINNARLIAGTLTNAGTLTGRLEVDIGTLFNAGVVALNGASTNGGSIVNTGTFATAGAFANDGAFTNSSGLTNTGTFTSTGALANSSTFTNGGTLANSGSFGNSGLFQNTGLFTNAGIFTNTGTLTGGGSLTTSGAFTNGGRVDGTVAMSGGAVTNLAGARILGVSAGISGEGAVVNAGQIMANGSDGTGIALSAGVVSSTAASAVIQGGQDGITSIGLATIINAGTVAGLAGVGIALALGGSLSNSGTVSGNSAGVRVAGGTATLTNSGLIAATGAGGIGVLFTETGQGTIDNFGTISGAGGTAVKFAGGTNTLIIESNGVLNGIADGSLGNNTLIVRDNAMLESVQAIGFRQVGFIDSTQVIDANSTITNPIVIAGTLNNQGTLNGRVQVNLAATLANAGLVSMDTPSTNGGVLANAGIFNNSSTLTNTGLVTNTGQMNNTGTIIGSGTIVTSGRFTNSGTVIADATGVSGVSGGAIVNSGTIIGTSDTGVNLGAGGSLTNAAGALVQGGRFGVQAGVGAVVSNAGTILDDDIAGALLASNAVLTNSASGTVGGVIGVLFNGTGASITNTGTITGTGGVAVQFGAGVNTLTLGTGAVLNGGLDGGGGAGQVVLTGTGALTSAITNFGGGSALTIASGAAWTASGTWTIASVSNSGTLKAGTPGSPLQLTGNFVQTPAGTFQVELAPSGQSSQLSITGSASIAGGVAVTKAPGAYLPGTRFTILTAAGGVFGAFSAPTQDLPFVDLLLAYDANDVYLDVSRNGTSFTAVAATPNDIATAGALEALGPSNALYGAIVAQNSVAGAQQAFNALSGEIYASTTTVLMDDSRLIRNALLDRMHGEGSAAAGASVAAMAGTGNAFWVQGFGSWGHTDGNGNASSLSRNTDGVFAGYDGTLADSWRVGFALGYSSSMFSVDALNSSGSSDNYHVAVYGGGALGAFDLKLGGAFTWSDISNHRSIIFPGFFQPAEADYSARTGQVFGELGYRMAFTRGMLEPFIGLAYVNVDTDSFREAGGVSALTGSGVDQSITYTTLGLHASSSFQLFALPATVKATLGWQHAFGDTYGEVPVAFASGSSFAITGVPVAKDSALLEVGFDVAVTANTTLGLYYNGQVASDAYDNMVKGSFTVKF